MIRKKQIDNRSRRARRTRAKIKQLEAVRLCIYRTPCHTYAQMISPDGATVLASASTVEKTLKKVCKGLCGNIAAAKVVGEHIAKRAVKLGIKKDAFDRSGFQYHGRVKALAEAAREHGLEF